MTEKAIRKFQRMYKCLGSIVVCSLFFTLLTTLCALRRMFHPVATDPFTARLFDRVLPKGLDDSLLNTCLCFESTSEETATRHTLLAHTLPQTEVRNVTLPERCLQIEADEAIYLPWNNPHNVASAEIETSSRHVKDLMLAFLFLIGGPANVINMAVFHRQSLQDRINLCLFALSLADELYLISAVTVYSEQLVLQFTTEERYGSVVTFLANHNLIGFTGFCFVSFVLSAIIASEKCRCVLSPLKFQAQLGIRTMASIICSVYCLVLGLYFLVAFRYRVGCLHDPDSGAVFRTGVHGEFYQSHRDFVDYLDSFVFGGVIPVAVISVVLVSTIITTVKLHQAMTWRTSASSVLSVREVALTKMLIGNSVLFIVCVSPPCLTRFICLFMPEMNMVESSQNFFLTGLWVTEVLSYVNASCNIFVYYGMGSRYRETLWALLGKKTKQSDKSRASTLRC